MTLWQRALGVEVKQDSGWVTPIERDVVYNDALPSFGMSGYLKLANDYTATYEEIARRQLWARIVINKIAYSIGRLPLKAYAGDDAPTRKRLRGTSLTNLLAHPNRTKEQGTTPGFLARVAYDLLVYGNAMILKAQTNATTAPLELRVLSPRYWALTKDGNYAYQPDARAEKQTFSPDRVIHIVEPGPTVSGFGISRLEAARLTLAIEYAAQRLGESTFNNSARPGGLITIKSGMPAEKRSRAEAMERFKAEVWARFGGVAKTGLPAVLEGDVDWQAMGFNLDDSAVVDHRQLTREEIAALYDIPQPAVGILDEANFASVDMLHVMFYQDTLGWPIKLIEESLNAQLIRGVREWDGQFVEFDVNAVMRGALSERLAAYNTGINAGIYTSDEVRGWENLPPRASEQPDADRLRFPLNYATEAGQPAGSTGG